MRLRVTPSSAAPYEWEAAARQFRVGRGDTCGLRFQGDAGAMVSWEHAEITSTADGTAYVTDLRSSNGTFVDGARISAQTPIRVGSIVQLGRSGPCLQVLGLDAAPTPAANLAPAARAAPIATSVYSSAEPLPANGASLWMVRNLGAFAALIVIATLGFFALRRPPATDAPVVNPRLPVAAPPPTAHATEPPKVAATVELPPAVARGSAKQAVVAKPVADPWSEARQRALESFRMIVVEDPKSHASWPFSGAVLVGDRTLLTTASMGLELAKFIGRGWQVAAMRPGEQARTAITELRVHAAYEQANQDEQLYFDMAVLSAAEPVGEPIVLASAAELAALETGLPLLGLAVDHALDPLDRFQQLEPQSYPCKIFGVTGLPPQPSGPKLLIVRGKFTEKACGSPILNQQGHLVALYCEPAPGSNPEAVDLHTHYAKVVEPQMIELAMHGTDARVWVRPQPPVPPSVRKEPSK